MCFAQDSLEETKQLGKMGLKRGNRAFGPRVCISCFNEHTVSKPHHSGDLERGRGRGRGREREIERQ